MIKLTIVDKIVPLTFSSISPVYVAFYQDVDWTRLMGSKCKIFLFTPYIF